MASIPPLAALDRGQLALLTSPAVQWRSVRTLLIILGTLAVLIVGFALAIAAGWVRIGHVDPFARVGSTTRPIAPREADDETSLQSTSQSSDPVLADAVELPPRPPDRTIVLRAGDARLTGRRVRLSEVFRPPEFGRGRRFDRQPPAIERAITGWTDPADTAEWTADVPKAGKYTVTLDYSTGAGRRSAGPGGAYVFTAGDATLRGDLEPTRGGRSYELVDIGVIELPKGPVHVKLSPAESTGESLMNLRGVRLFLTE
jgi:hypothetical protein